MKYIVIDDVHLNSDRLCFYFGYDPSQATDIKFAAQKKVNEKHSSIKGKALEEVIAWLGFDGLSLKLFASPKFSKKYKVSIYPVLDNLKICKINSIPSFFYKNSGSSEWFYSESIAEIELIFGMEIQDKIQKDLGNEFLNEILDHVKETENQKRIFNDYLEEKKKLAESKLANDNGNENSEVVGNTTSEPAESLG